MVCLGALSVMFEEDCVQCFSPDRTSFISMTSCFSMKTVNYVCLNDVFFTNHLHGVKDSVGSIYSIHLTAIKNYNSIKVKQVVLVNKTLMTIVREYWSVKLVWGVTNPEFMESMFHTLGIAQVSYSTSATENIFRFDTHRKVKF